MAATTSFHPRAPHPILIVDDDVEIIETLTDLLADEGLPAVGAMSGQEAERAACAHAPSLVLLDDQIGADRAPEVARLLRARCGDALPIVLLSGGIDLASAAREAGVVAALPKPLAIDDLLRCIRLHRTPQ